MPPSDDVGEPAPDSFFAGETRRRVVLIGVVLLLAGVGVIVLALTVGAQAGGAPRAVGFLVFAGIALLVGGVVCVVKKPSSGSAPGSEEYKRVTLAAQRAAYAVFMRNAIITSVLGAGLAVVLIISGLSATEVSTRVGSVVVGTICAVIAMIAAIGLRRARQGKLKHIKPPHLP